MVKLFCSKKHANALLVVSCETLKLNTRACCLRKKFLLLTTTERNCLSLSSRNKNIYVYVRIKLVEVFSYHIQFASTETTQKQTSNLMIYDTHTSQSEVLIIITRAFIFQIASDEDRKLKNEMRFKLNINWRLLIHQIMCFKKSVVKSASTSVKPYYTLGGKFHISRNKLSNLIEQTSLALHAVN